MVKNVICNCGTSAATKWIKPPTNLEKWVRDNGGPEKAGKLIADYFINIAPDGNDLQNTLSAEIHSLVRIGIAPGDRVVLLASDTSDGYACALAVEQYLNKWWTGVTVKAHTVKGLQVMDEKRFRREGVVEFVRICLDEINYWGPEQCILNPTGGFKALVPYAVVVGMIKRVPCRYIFERSAALLNLPPLPIDIDRSYLEHYRQILESIEREGVISLKYWQDEVDYADQERLFPLVEVDGEYITLSGVGELLLAELHRPVDLVPFLSRWAWEDCLGLLRELPGCDPFRYLQKVAGSEKLLNQDLRKKGENDWLKPGNTSDRYLVSKEGWRLLVWRAIREDQEGPNYPTTVKVDLNRDRRSSRYAPFTRLDMFWPDNQ